MSKKSLGPTVLPLLSRAVFLCVFVTIRIIRSLYQIVGECHSVRVFVHFTVAIASHVVSPLCRHVLLRSVRVQVVLSKLLGAAEISSLIEAEAAQPQALGRNHSHCDAIDAI